MNSKMNIINMICFCTLTVLAIIAVSKSQDTVEQVCDSLNNNNDCKIQTLQNKLEKQAVSLKQMEDKERKDCSDLFNQGYMTSGVYDIYTGLYSEAKPVFCDMETDGGGWTVFQSRQDGSVNFEKTWDEYKQRFGDPSGEHWLGNKYIHELTSNGRAYNLRIVLTDWEDITKHATYSFFTVDYEQQKFRMSYDEYLPQESTVGNSLSTHKNQDFTTLDRDNDHSSGNCATNNGGFWFNECQTAGLNNHYSSSSDGYGDNIYDSIRWDSWHGSRYSLMSTKMMIRPIQ